jgi:hypothetical protein
VASFSVPLAACFGSGVTTLNSAQKGHTARQYRSVCSVENAIRLFLSTYSQNILRPLTTNTFQHKFRTLPSLSTRLSRRLLAFIIFHALRLGFSRWECAPEMALSKECLTADGKTITVAEALKSKRDKRSELKCISCGQRVSPHRRSTSGKQAAHFEHVPSDGGRNPACPRSDPSRSQ